MIKKILTKSEAETKTLAKRLAKNLRGDEILAFKGDLGAGKTTFIQGLAEALGVKTRVLSPTFVLQRIHKGKKHRLFHYDFYRLGAGEIEDLDLRENLGQGIVAIEWSEKMARVPAGSVEITIKEKGPTKREFTFHFPADRNYLAKNL